MFSGSEELKKHYLTKLAAGRGRLLLLPVRARGRLRRGVAMKTRAVRDGDGWVLDGVKRWITNAGVSEFYTVMAVTDPEKGAPRHLGVRGREVRRRASPSAPRRRSSASRAARPARSTSTTSASRPTG